MKTLRFNLKSTLHSNRHVGRPAQFEESTALLGGAPPVRCDLRNLPFKPALVPVRISAPTCTPFGRSRQQYASVNQTGSDDGEGDAPAWPRFYERRSFWCVLGLVIIMIVSAVTLGLTLHRPKVVKSPPPPAKLRYAPPTASPLIGVVKRLKRAGKPPPPHSVPPPPPPPPRLVAVIAEEVSSGLTNATVVGYVDTTV